ncbi:hypothetical protein LUZ61_019450 [Rhynchospora tenuis]|uniref:VQ domain-containing protein n=1 Tax=Rhynchospora tenuis TaxID=198213 RepID=A0AAD6EN52_9POAL|nr:hypothetical protein LUZ61_019450 [Rhynchospora tenuis]
MDPSRNNHQHHHHPNSNHNPHLGVSKLSKPIRKSPLPPPPFQPATRPAQSQPQVYNISKNDFRDIVQQLTGTPSRDPIPSHPPPPPTNPHPPPRPPYQRPQSQPSQRLQKIRPPPLTPIARPAPPPPPYQNPNPNPTFPSPVTAYMRYLESSLLETSRHPQAQGGLLPSPVGPPPQPPVMPGPPPMHMPPFPSPRGMPSPYPLQSPSAFLNLVSPKSPYPLLSPPGHHYPAPLSPGLALSPGILGPAPGPPPFPSPGPLSPGFFFPNSPSGLLSPSTFFPIQSPRWRNG